MHLAEVGVVRIHGLPFARTQIKVPLHKVLRDGKPKKAIRSDTESSVVFLTVSLVGELACFAARAAFEGERQQPIRTSTTAGNDRLVFFALEGTLRDLYLITETN